MSLTTHHSPFVIHPVAGGSAPASHPSIHLYLAIPSPISSSHPPPLPPIPTSDFPCVGCQFNLSRHVTSLWAESTRRLRLTSRPRARPDGLVCFSPRSSCSCLGFLDSGRHPPPPTFLTASALLTIALFQAIDSSPCPPLAGHSLLEAHLQNPTAVLWVTFARSPPSPSPPTTDPELPLSPPTTSCQNPPLPHTWLSFLPLLNPISTMR